MTSKNQRIHMGEHTIDVLKEMETGSAFLTPEEFAAVLFYADLDEELESEIKKVKEFYSSK